MKTCTLLSTIIFFAATWGVQAAESPAMFFRSGQKVSLPLLRSDLRAEEPFALAAFGRRWDVSMMQKDGTVRFIAPQVRVPVVFQFVVGKKADVYFSSIVIYPDKDVHWNKDFRLTMVGGRSWFDQWSDAVGLPVAKHEDVAALLADNRLKRDNPGLLIVAKKKAAGAELAEIERAAAERRLNLLVLDADWFGEIRADERGFAVLPKQMAGALADIQEQQWAIPPVFRQYVLPWKEIVNRRTWITGSEYPLVEEIFLHRTGAESPRIVLSYLPWREELGRNEVADELFLRLLTEAAKSATDRPSLTDRWYLLFPEAKDVKTEERPVLTAALHSAAGEQKDASPAATDDGEVRAYVLDLRGGPSPTRFLESPGVKAAEFSVDKDLPLLILGDDAVLDAWKWLKLDRDLRRASRPGVFWWPDDTLNPSSKSQLRLMRQFTAWNIFLGKIPEEENDESHEN